MINIVLDNYIKVSGLPRHSFDMVVKRLTYPNPLFINAIKYSKGKVGRIPRTVKSYNYKDNQIWLPRGYYLEFLTKIVATSGFPYQIIDKRVKTEIAVPNSTIKLRSYQEKMVHESAIYPGPAFIMQAPPGTGKTITGLELARRLKRKTLWITHTKELANQTREAAANLYNISKKEIGMIGQGKFDIGEFLTIGMIQTLYRKREQLAKLQYEFGVVIVDEVHHAPASSWQSATHSLSPEFTFGLTATSYRNDGLTSMMFDCMGPVVTVADKNLLAKENVLIVPSVYMLNTGVTIPGHDYSSVLSDLTKSEYRNNLLIDVIKDIMNNEKNVLIALSARRKHVETLVELCQTENLFPLKMLGDMSKLNRTLAAEQIKERSAKLIIATYKLLSEGFDYPPINFVLFATPFKDSVLLEQCIGRAQRISEGKSNAIIIDPVDNNVILMKQAGLRRLIYQGLGINVSTLTAHNFNI